jgi:hypothetical protein
MLRLTECEEKPMSSTNPPGPFKPTGDPGRGTGGGAPGQSGGTGDGTGGSGESGSDPTGLPWEHRDQLGVTAALVGTVKGVLLEPADTFRAMRTTGGVGEPLIYAVLLGWVGGLFGLVWQTLISAVVPLVAAGAGLEDMAQSMVGTVIMAILMPVFIVMGQFIGAAIIHLFALMFGAGDKGFEVTFRVLAYSSGSTAVLNVVPIFGGIAASIWSIVATVFGLIEAQETTAGRAVAAVVVPIVLCCCCGVGLALAFGFAAGMTQGF